MTDEAPEQFDPVDPTEAFNGIAIARVFDDSGGFSTNVAVLGDCKSTEVETILQFALKTVRAQLGY